jgi:trk system potassium uptake protein TrkA
VRSNLVDFRDCLAVNFIDQLRIDEIDLPKGATIGAIVRNGEVIMGHHDRLIESEDHVIVFVINKKMISKVEKLFQVSIGFF